MDGFTYSELEILRSFLDSDGYVFNFTNDTFSEFCIGHVKIDILEKYKQSKAKSLMSFFRDDEVEEKKKIILLRELINYYNSYSTTEIFQFKSRIPKEKLDTIRDQCNDILSRRKKVLETVNVLDINEAGIQELILEAQEYYSQDKQVALEKIWDAYERIKSYYSDLDKKNSVKKIIKTISNGNDNYVSFMDKEFKELNEIGNTFQIRHKEINKIKLINDDYRIYFFNKCLNLIILIKSYIQF